MPSPLRQLAIIVSLAATLASAAGCAHNAGRSGPLSESARRFAGEAATVRAIAFEEDFVDARLVYHALPVYAPERTALRRRLIDYLLGPVGQLDGEDLRRRGGEVGVSDDIDRVLASFRDALELYVPEELWGGDGPQVPAEEKALLVHAARLVVSLFAARGAENEVATGLLVLASLDPKNRTWGDRLAELFPWIETGAQLSLTGAGPRSAPTTTDVLETAVSAWPAPNVTERLAANYIERQDRLTSLLRRPLGSTPPRAPIGDLLLEGETVQSTAFSVASLYLRCGQVERAAQALKRIAGKPGDDPELRQLVSKAAASRAGRAEYLALSRRFLPRSDLLGGTSSDRIDVPAALQVLILALGRWPQDPEILVLAARLAHVMEQPYLSLRYLEEAQPLLERAGASRDDQAELAAEILDRSFRKLRVRMVDTEHLEPATREAETLRRRFAESRKRFGDDRLKALDADIDLELGRGLLNAGLIDRAEALFQRAGKEGEPRMEVALELAKLATKRGDGRRAAELLEEALDQQRAAAGARETIGSVQSQSRLAYALGNALEVAGRQEEARNAWKLALRGWERLMIEHLRSKTLGASAEATMEVGRLNYLLGRRQEGVAKFVDAIEQLEGRDQSYIDSLAFLVQRGDVDAVLDIYRRAMSKPSRTVSEYVKVYASLWVLDLTRRSGQGPEPAAEAFLRTLDARKVQLRPMRAAAWYTELARYALGRISYEELLPRADTAGKRAEIYFYEAMRRLADGRSDDAHALWNKVLETRMFEFLEFDMASRYLRSGAPTHAQPDSNESETI
jgi:tetratricopeptide (TPR) repeat protein